MARSKRVHPDPAPISDLDPDEGPIDDATSLVAVAGTQTANGVAQGLIGVAIVYGMVRIGGVLVRFLRSGGRTRD